MKITQSDYIKAVKRADRKLVVRYSPTNVHRSKKQYVRKPKHRNNDSFE